MTTSSAFQQHAKSRIPGMTQLLSKRPDMFSFGVWPAYYSKAKGARVWDLEGKEYLDMSIAGIGACVLGYADEDVDEAVIRAIHNGVASSLNCPEEVELADLLCTIHPWAQMVRYTRSGGEALSLGVRLARAYTGRDVIAFCGYHGWSDWYLAANLAENAALDGHLLPGLQPLGVPRALKGTSFPFQYNKLEELKVIAGNNKGKLAGIVMEPLREKEPAPGFIEGIRDIADTTGAVLIMDEVSAGFRYCTGGAHLVKHTVTPDIAVFSKALGNGYSISAVIGLEKIMQTAQNTFISSTNWTDRVGPSAALATIHKFQSEKPHQKFRKLGKKIKNGWREIALKHNLNIEVCGMDAMAHFSLKEKEFLSLKAYFVQLMLEKGFLASNLCYLMNAHTETDVFQYLNACDESFQLLAEAKVMGDIKKRLRGQPAASGFTRLA